LAPVPGTPVTIEHSNLASNMKQWDGAKLVKYDPSASKIGFQHVARTQDQTPRIAAILFAAGAGVLLLIVAARVVMRRRT
jgi:hypothetical protein